MTHRLQFHTEAPCLSDRRCCVHGASVHHTGAGEARAQRLHGGPWGALIRGGAAAHGEAGAHEGPRRDGPAEVSAQ